MGIEGSKSASSSKVCAELGVVVQGSYVLADGIIQVARPFIVHRRLQTRLAQCGAAHYSTARPFGPASSSTELRDRLIGSQIS